METKSVTVSIQPHGKNMVIAYLLWWFLGWAGVHRFYLGKKGSGIAQLILFILGWLTAVVIVGFIFIGIWSVWWLLDAYFVQKYVTETNNATGLSSSAFTFNSAKQGSNNFEQLEKLHALFEKGIITKEQYEAKKVGLI